MTTFLKILFTKSCVWMWKWSIFGGFFELKWVFSPILSSQREYTLVLWMLLYRNVLKFGSVLKFILFLAQIDILTYSIVFWIPCSCFPQLLLTLFLVFWQVVECWPKIPYWPELLVGPWTEIISGPYHKYVRPIVQRNSQNDRN